MKITQHGTAKSKYDSTIRAMVTQYVHSEASLETIASCIRQDIAGIKRANTATASANYSVKVKDRFEPTERIEIWNEVIPGKERLIVTITKNQP